MSYQGRGALGNTFIGRGNSSGPSFVPIGTESGLTLHGLVVAEATGAFQATGAGTVGQVMQSGGPAANPSYSTAKYPSTTSINQILYSPSDNTVSGLTAANSATLVSTSAGVPVWSSTMTNGQLIIGSTGTTPTAASLTASTGIVITPGAASISIAINTATVGQTITGDSGGALSPTAGNWNIISTATNGIDTSGSGSSLTVAMATPYADGDFEFRSTLSGATRTLSVTNTSNTASSQATLLTSVAGTTAGDAWNQWTIGTTRSFSLGVDNSDTNDSLKFTTDADATVDPSSGTFLGAINPTTGGFEWGPNANGISNTNRVFSIRKDQDTGTTLYVNNNTSGESALTAVQIESNSGDVLLLASIDDAYMVDPNIAGYAYIHAIRGGGQGDLMMQANTFTFTQDTGTDILGKCTSAGEWTYPFQPAFLAIRSTNDTDVTGDGTIVTLIADTEVFDQGGDYNNGTGIFTAPVTGRYMLTAQIYCLQLGVANTIGVMNIVTSNRTYVLDTPHLVAVATRTFMFTVLADMDTNDTAYVTLGVYGSTKTVDFLGNATTAFTSFSGHLVC